MFPHTYFSGITGHKRQRYNLKFSHRKEKYAYKKEHHYQVAIF